MLKTQHEHTPTSGNILIFKMILKSHMIKQHLDEASIIINIFSDCKRGWFNWLLLNLLLILCQKFSRTNLVMSVFLSFWYGNTAP